MSDSAVTLRTKKFITNRLLQRGVGQTHAGFWSSFR